MRIIGVLIVCMVVAFLLVFLYLDTEEKPWGVLIGTILVLAAIIGAIGIMLFIGIVLIVKGDLMW